MSESTGEGATFEARLAAMDRRLRDIQAELEPEREPRPGWATTDPVAGPPPASPVHPRLSPAPDPEPPPRLDFTSPQPRPPARQPVELLGGLYGRLVASMRELLDGYELALEQIAGTPGEAAADGLGALAGASAGDPAGEGLTVVAGPFATTAALKQFERALSGLPGVSHAAVRGYEAGDRAVVEVQLDPRERVAPRSGEGNP